MIKALIAGCASELRRLGTPAKHHGRDENGIDCIGLALRPLEAWNGEVPAEFLKRDYPQSGDPVRLRAFLDWFGDVVTFDEISPGDLALFAFAGREVHVGVITRPGVVTHAYRPLGRVVEHNLAGKWRDRFVCGFSWRDKCSSYSD